MTELAALSPVFHTFIRTWLGTTLVAATSKGLAAVLLGEDRDALIADLTRLFRARPTQAVSRETESMKAAADAVEQAFDNPAEPFDFPFDLQGTDFQRRVWQGLLEIPPGTTVTYSDLAAAVTDVKAVRAVAAACGANPVSVIIPCHRVIGRNGQLTGYYWGVETKRRLLAAEARFAGDLFSGLASQPK